MAQQLKSSQHIQALETKAAQDPEFTELLVASLRLANQHASAPPPDGLAPNLYKALEWWPTSLEGYVTYLNWFARWAPRQSSDEAWLDPNSPVGEHQEVYDRLCHFYYIINQPAGSDDSVVQNIDWFAKWLVDYANLWGEFLDTTESFSEEILDSFKKLSPLYRVQDSLIDGKPNRPGGWQTFNQFFARELNEGLRPIDAPADNAVVTCPADCTFKAVYSIDSDSSIPQITIKGTHRFANVEDLLKDSEYKSAFAGGSFVHYFLAPYSYHRFHTPVAGVVKECHPVQGLVYLNVNMSGQQFHAPDASGTTQGGKGAYEFSQARGIIVLDTAGSPDGDIGLVCTIPVGMCQVSSVKMDAELIGQTVSKGAEFGNFFFGGSDIIVLFQKGVASKIDDNGKLYRHYGTRIADCNKK